MFKRYAFITDGKVTNIVEQEDFPPEEFNPIESAIAQIGDSFDGVTFVKPLPPTHQTRVVPYTVLRQSAFTAEADPLFFQQQRGEVPSGTWEAKIAEIKAMYPKP